MAFYFNPAIGDRFGIGCVSCKTFYGNSFINDIGGVVIAGQTDGAEAGTLVEGSGDDLPKSETSLAIIAQSSDQAEFAGEGVEHDDGGDTWSLHQGLR